MTGVNEIRCAAKEYRCTEKSWHTIKRGDYYLYWSMTPWHECARGNKWEIVRACLRCAKEFGMLNSDNRARLAQVEAVTNSEAST